MAGVPRKIAARVAAVLLALVLLGVGRADAITLPPDFTDTLVASANQPTALAFVPGGRLLIGEEAGLVRVLPSGASTPVTALDIRTRVCSDGERGLMSVAVDPQFESNHFVYVHYTYVKNGCDYDSATTPVNRVSRFVLNDNNTVDANNETVLIDNIPAPQSYHIGADLQFGKDGLLYISTGDGGCDYAADSGCLENNDATRDQNVLLGKILRITRDGAIPAGNPWQGPGTARCNTNGRTTTGTRCQETFAWGLRNPFRLAMDPNSSTTRFFINDVGEITWEEIDLGQVGADYGWNVREGFCATGSTTDCGAPPAGMTNPIFAYSHEPSGCYAITGGTFVPKGLWSPSYDDDYLYADLVCGKIFRLAPQPGGGYSASEWATGVESPTTMTFGPAPGGRYSLYYTTWAASGHQVRRITYNGADRAGYPRPKGASPLRVSLTTAFAACTAPNRTHGPPLAHPACNPPVQTSQQLTVGTPDANGQPSAFVGSVRLGVRPGDPTTTADEADVAVVVNTVDVRRRSDLGDYTGQLGLRLPLRITDRDNGGTSTTSHGTVQDANLDMPVPCTANPTSVGSTCSLATTVDAVAPGAAREGERAVWGLDRIQVFDGGADGVASTAPNTLFATQGVFVP